MSIFSGPKEKDELVLVFNIGPSSVGGSLFFAQKTGIPKIIFSIREPVVVKEKMDVDNFLSLTLQALEIVVEKVHKAKMGAPSKIFCVLSLPLYSSQTRVISLKKNTPFVFTSKLADDLIQKEIKLFEEEHLAKSVKDGNSIHIIELKNIKTTLNGYETSKPLDQKVKELEMTIFISMSEEQILNKIENVIAKHFHTKQIKYSSLAMATFAVVRDMYIKQENFLLVVIGGEVTDISMIKKNILRDSISYPLGRNFLTRGVSAELGCSISEANSLISLYKDGHAEEAVAKKLELILGKLRKEWLNKFQESLANLSNDISIPSTVYIAIDKDLADFFSETIKTEQFSQYTLTDSKFEVVFLSTELLHGVALFEDNVIREPFLILDSVYINRFLINV